MTINKSTIIKFVELVVVCVLIGLHYYSFSDAGQNTAMLTMGTFGGFLIILVGTFIGIVIGSGFDRRLDMFFSVVGCILFIIVGALVINHFSNSVYRSSFRDTGIAKGCISIAEGIVFLVDLIFAFRGEA